MPKRNPLLCALRDPSALPGFSIKDWDLMLRQARQAKLSAYLSYLIEDFGIESRCPRRALDMLKAARYFPAFLQTQARCEIRQLRRVLGPLRIPMILLKGAAYLCAGLPVSRGRHLSDVDLLVPRERLADAEALLLANGWEPQKITSYDQRYYREWMHEIPPLRHKDRSIELDVHHTLLPLTARLHPDPTALWEAARELPDQGVMVLAPVDMLLHSAAHLFYDGDLQGGLRDLVDLHELMRHYGKESAFWGELTERARLLELGAPLFFAIHFCHRLLATPIPEETIVESRDLVGSRPATLVTRFLMRRSLLPKQPEGMGSPVAAWLLYVRSHWLRMPPGLLAAHLGRKAWKRFRDVVRPHKQGECRP